MPRDTIIPLPCCGHCARCRVTLSDAEGWEVRLEVDDEVVTATHCSDWHRVERVCDRIERVWLHDHPPESPRA